MTNSQRRSFAICDLKPSLAVCSKHVDALAEFAVTYPYFFGPDETHPYFFVPFDERESEDVLKGRFDALLAETDSCADCLRYQTGERRGGEVK